MGNNNQIKSVTIKNLIVKDTKLIKKLNEKYLDQFYIPPFETRKDSKTGINWELVDDGNYVKSKDKVGEISEIIIAICDDDPYISDENSIYKIDGRILDGRTRYLSSVKHDVKWDHKFISVENFEQFVWLWCHFNSLKGGNILDETSKFYQLCKYKNEIIGMEKEKIGQSIIEQYGNNQPFNNKTLRRRIRPEFKEGIKIKAQLQKEVKEVEKKIKQKKKLHKKDKLFILENENQDLIKQNFTLDDELKETKNKVKICDEIKTLISEPQKISVPGKRKKIKISFDIVKKEFVIHDS